MIDSPEPPPSRRSRLEDEVLEILIKNDRPPTPGERLNSNMRRQRGQLGRSFQRVATSISSPFDSGLWLLLCVALGFIAFLLRDLSPLAARFLALGAFALFIIAVVRSFRRPRDGGIKQWRGRDISYSRTQRPEWLERLLRNHRRPPR